MFQFLRCYSLVSIACCLLPAQAPAPSDGVRGNLAGVEWLSKHLQHPEVLILDASPAQVYSAGHIPGAISVDLYTYGLPDMPAAQMERRFQSWGVSPEKTIVIYDQGGNMMATRTFFALYYYGVAPEHLLVLDGGMFQWQQKGLAVAKESTAALKQGAFKAAKLNQDARADLPEVLAASGDRANNALVEALSAGWHFGEVQAFDRAGHIPNGILLPSADFYNPDKTFKSAEEIRRMFDYVGVRPEQQIYTYCGGGVAASVPYFALKFILKYPKVKMYQESELGWLADERQLPYWTYDAPYLMRDANWLQFWGGQRIRSAGLTRVSIVDVRPADGYRQGHVPFALNIPAEVFQRNSRNPEKLAEILGAAGVDASHEAVIISSAGLTKDAALAFLMLEKLGQRKVSVFVDVMERWVKLGYPLTGDATPVGSRRSPQDTSIPPTSYPRRLAPGVVIPDPASTHGIYPKVFIDAGQNASAKPQNGRVVHVPYTDLLNPDGTPKAAKEIWNLLTKAGVPRYAELVCYSDDPGAAAVNYFILKLMGFPDIKVLLA